MKCLVCGKELGDNYYCKNCHYLNADGVDAFSDEERERLISEHKATKEYKESDAYYFNNVSEIKNISVKTYKYGWVEDEKKFRQIGNPRSVVIANSGKDCLDHIVWSEDVEFAQDINDDIKERNVEISYEINGQSMVETFAIIPKRANDFLKIGVKIDKEMKMSIYLGRKDARETIAESKKKAIRFAA